MKGEQADPSRPRHRCSFYAALLGVLLVLGVIVGYQVLLAQLNQPYFKRLLNSYVALPQGMSLDYQRLELAPLSGRLQIVGLKIGSPTSHRSHTPLLLELERLSVHWSTRSLLTKEIRVDAVDARGLRLYDVVQEDGPSTWDLLGDRDHAEPESLHPPAPLSKVAQLDWLPRALNLRALSLADLSLARTELDLNGHTLRQLELRGFRLAAEALLTPGNAAARMTLQSTAADSPTRLTIHDQGRNQSLAELQLAVVFNLSGSRSVEFSAVADLLRQTIDPSWGLSGRVVEIEGTAEFAADADVSRLVVKRFNILQGAVSAEFTAELSDHSTVPKLVGRGEAHLDPLLNMKTGVLPGLQGKDMYVNGRFVSHPDEERTFQVEVAARAGEVVWRRPEGQSLTMGRLSLDLRGTVDPDVRAGFEARAPIHDVTYRDPLGRSISVNELLVTLESHEWSFDAQTPSAVAGTIASATVQIAEPRHPWQRVAEHTRFRWAADDVAQHDSPLPVSGRLTINGVVDELELAAQVRLQDDAADAEVTVKAPKLDALVQWLPELKSQGIHLDQTGMEASVVGRYRHLGRADGLELNHVVAATLTGLNVQRPDASVTLPAIGLKARHRLMEGTDTLTAEIDFGRARLNGVAVEKNPRLTASVERTAAEVHAQADFTMDPALALSVHGTIEVASGAVTHRSRLTLDHAKVLRQWIPKPLQERYPIDWSTFSGTLEQQGRIEGLLVMRPDHPMPELTNRPLNSLVAEQSIAIDLHGLAFDDGTTVVDLPHGTLRAGGSQRSGRITGRADVATPRARFVYQGEEISLASLTQQVEFSADASHLADGDMDLRMAGTLQSLRQSYVPFYRIADVTLSGRAHLSRLYTFVLDDFTLQNKGGGTHITLSKSLNRAGATSSAEPSRPSLRELTLSGRLTQSLQALTTPTGSFHGQGVITAPLTLYSSDGMLFNIAASVQMDDVGLTVPDAGLHVEGLSGRIHLDETFEWDGADGLSVVHDSDRNHFANNRYQDAQPFLANQSFFKIGTLVWHERTMGPIIGSLHVKNNVFSVNKLKIQKEQGAISGQLIFDYYPGAEQITFHGNVTGVRFGKSQDPLDGNMAVVFVPAKLELDGRIQILRLTRPHLEELLDLLDPFREDSGLNRLRFALAFGYPNFVRMELSQGLAALRVELAGIGKLLTIDEIRGIALGPFMSRHVEPLLKTWWADPEARDALATAPGPAKPVIDAW